MKLNLIIDALLLLCIAMIAGIGLLIKYVLIPGYLRWEIYNQNVELFFRGLDRHQWGTIHLVIGYVFLALLVLHIALHWQMIVRIYRQLIPSRLTRWIVALILVCLTVLFFTFSFFVKPKIQERTRRRLRPAGLFGQLKQGENLYRKRPKPKMLHNKGIQKATKNATL